VNHNYHSDAALFHARSQQVLRVLEDWKLRNTHEWMPLWKMHRRMPWRVRELQEVLDALMSQRLIAYQSIRGAGRADEFYRLACTPAEIREHARAEPADGLAVVMRAIATHSQN
jgi:hypothetical protein